jgi:hypothetical protein
MLLHRLNSEVINLLHVAGTRDKSDNLGERDSSPIITVPDDRGKGVVVYGVQIERDLG